MCVLGWFARAVGAVGGGWRKCEVGATRVKGVCVCCVLEQALAPSPYYLATKFSLPYQRKIERERAKNIERNLRVLYGLGVVAALKVNACCFGGELDTLGLKRHVVCVNLELLDVCQSSFLQNIVCF